MTTTLNNEIRDWAERQRAYAESPKGKAELARVVAEHRAQEEQERREHEEYVRHAADRARAKKEIPSFAWPLLDRLRVGELAGLPASAALATRWVERFLAGKAEWVFLFLGGPPGTGKSVAACRFLDAQIKWVEPDRGIPEYGGERIRESEGMFVSADRLVTEGVFGDGAAAWKTWAETPRLVLDDLGCERLDAKDFALTNLLHLLGKRHANGLRTVVTMNLNRAAFLERYATRDGGRLRDRLKESAWFVELTGPSLRPSLQLEDLAP